MLTSLLVFVYGLYLLHISCVTVWLVDNISMLFQGSGSMSSLEMIWVTIKLGLNVILSLWGRKKLHWRKNLLIVLWEGELARDRLQNET